MDTFETDRLPDFRDIFKSFLQEQIGFHQKVCLDYSDLLIIRSLECNSVGEWCYIQASQKTVEAYFAPNLIQLLYLQITRLEVIIELYLMHGLTYVDCASVSSAM